MLEDLLRTKKTRNGRDTGDGGPSVGRRARTYRHRRTHIGTDRREKGYGVRLTRLFFRLVPRE